MEPVNRSWITSTSNGLPSRKSLHASRLSRSVVVQHQVLGDTHSMRSLVSGYSDGVFLPAMAEGGQYRWEPRLRSPTGDRTIKCQFVAAPGDGSIQLLKQCELLALPATLVEPERDRKGIGPFKICRCCRNSDEFPR